MKKIFILALVFFAFSGTLFASERKILKAEVLEILETGEQVLVDDFTTFTQRVSLEIKSGPRTGDVIEISNDYTPLQAGDNVYLSEVFDGGEYFYNLFEIDRTPVILILLFV